MTTQQERIERAMDRPRPSRDDAHRFRPSDLYSLCEWCGRSASDGIHFDSPANYWRMGQWWRPFGRLRGIGGDD